MEDIFQKHLDNEIEYMDENDNDYDNDDGVDNIDGEWEEDDHESVIDVNVFNLSQSNGNNGKYRNYTNNGIQYQNDKNGQTNYINNNDNSINNSSLLSTNDNNNNNNKLSNKNDKKVSSETSSSQNMKFVDNENDCTNDNSNGN